jgi:hypothetical protein
MAPPKVHLRGFRVEEAGTPVGGVPNYEVHEEGVEAAMASANIEISTVNTAYTQRTYREKRPKNYVRAQDGSCWRFELNPAFPDPALQWSTEWKSAVLHFYLQAEPTARSPKSGIRKWTAAKHATLQQQLGSGFHKGIECTRQMIKKLEHAGSVQPQVAHQLARLLPDQRPHDWQIAFTSLFNGEIPVALDTGILWRLTSVVDETMMCVLDGTDQDTLRRCLRLLNFETVKEVTQMLLQANGLNAIPTWGKELLKKILIEELSAEHISSESRRQILINVIISRGVGALSPMLSSCSVGLMAVQTKLEPKVLDLVRLSRVAAHVLLDLGAAAATRGRKFLEILADANFAEGMSQIITGDGSHCASLEPCVSEFERLHARAVTEIVQWSALVWIFVDRISQTRGYTPTNDIPDLCQYVASAANTHASIVAAVAEKFGLQNIIYMLGNHSGRLAAGDSTAYAVSDSVNLADSSHQLRYADLQMDKVMSIRDTICQHPGAVFCALTLDRLSMADAEISNVLDDMATHGCYFHAVELGPVPLRVPVEWRADHQFMIISALIVRFH